MTTITERQSNYLTSLREDFTPDHTTINRNKERLAELLRITGLRSAMVKRATNHIDDSTARGRRDKRAAEKEFWAEFDALSEQQQEEKRNEVFDAISDFAEEEIAAMKWAQKASITTKEDASKAIDFLSRPHFIFATDISVVDAMLVDQFTRWYTAR